MNNLPITEELDFAYLLELMPALHHEPGFAWLPELFATIGAERLITLCKYAGGETLVIPTLDELSTSVEALQFFYDINIKKTKTVDELPLALRDKYYTICGVYNSYA